MRFCGNFRTYQPIQFLTWRFWVDELCKVVSGLMSSKISKKSHLLQFFNKVFFQFLFSLGQNECYFLSMISILCQNFDLQPEFTGFSKKKSIFNQNFNFYHDKLNFWKTSKFCLNIENFGQKLKLILIQNFLIKIGIFWFLANFFFFQKHNSDVLFGQNFEF